MLALHVDNDIDGVLTISLDSGSCPMSSADSDSDDAGSAISALDSSAALILVHDQDEPPSPLDFTDDASAID